MHLGEVAILRIYTSSFYDKNAVNDSHLDVLNLESNQRKNAEANIAWGLQDVVVGYSSLVDGDVDIMGIQEVGWDDVNNMTTYRADIMIYAKSNN